MIKTYTVPHRNPEFCDKEILWVSDIHADSCPPEELENFIQELLDQKASEVLIGGDISTGEASLEFLRKTSETTKKTLYFILGNHDFYGHSIKNTRQRAKKFCQSHSTLNYLTESRVYPLSQKTALIGHDGWADGRAGDFLTSTVSLNDYFLIDDLKNLEGSDLLAKLQKLGDEAADQLGHLLEEALAKYSYVIVLTHAPPFQEVCCYHGQKCNPNWGPHFVCEAMGQKILSTAEKYPQREVLVLCGHSHSHAEARLSPNVQAIAAEAVIGAPCVQAVIKYN